MNNEAQKIQAQINALQKETPKILKEIGELNKKAADKAFGSKSFDGKKWPDSKEHNNDLLIKTGRLKKSIKYSVTGNTVKVISDVPYAIYHNEGTKNLPKRQFVGNSIEVDKQTIKTIQDKIKNIFK